jgi:hypothetical protein
MSPRAGPRRAAEQSCRSRRQHHRRVGDKDVFVHIGDVEHAECAASMRAKRSFSGLSPIAKAASPRRKVCAAFGFGGRWRSGLGRPAALSLEIVRPGRQATRSGLLMMCLLPRRWRAGAATDRHCQRSKDRRSAAVTEHRNASSSVGLSTDQAEKIAAFACAGSRDAMMGVTLYCDLG